MHAAVIKATYHQTFFPSGWNCTDIHYGKFNRILPRKNCFQILVKSYWKPDANNAMRVIVDLTHVLYQNMFFFQIRHFFTIFSNIALTHPENYNSFKPVGATVRTKMSYS